MLFRSWSGLPLPSPGDLPNLGIEPASPALAGRFFTAEPPGRLLWVFLFLWIFTQNSVASQYTSNCPGYFRSVQDLKKKKIPKTVKSVGKNLPISKIMYNIEDVIFTLVSFLQIYTILLNRPDPIIHQIGRESRNWHNCKMLPDFKGVRDKNVL